MECEHCEKLQTLSMVCGVGVVGGLSGLVVFGLGLLTQLLDHLGGSLDWNILAMLLGHLVTALLWHLVTLLLRHLATVLLGVLLADCGGHLDILVVTNLLWNILALLLGLGYGFVVA